MYTQKIDHLSDNQRELLQYLDSTAINILSNIQRNVQAHMENTLLLIQDIIIDSSGDRQHTTYTQRKHQISQKQPISCAEIRD